MSQHHLPETVLTEYAAGSSPEPVSLMVASHITLCGSCRETVDMLDDLGGALLETSTLEDKAGESVPPELMKRLLEDDRDAFLEASDDRNDVLDVVMPRPLRDYVGRPLRDVPWRKITRSLDVFDILTDVKSHSTRLMRVARGAEMPRHTHEGEEFTLILQGGMSDHNGVYHRGDVAIGSPDIDHSPRAFAEEDCICLAVNADKVRLTGPIGRWLNPFIKF